jgi:hypothetical protein
MVIQQMPLLCSCALALIAAATAATTAAVAAGLPPSITPLFVPSARYPCFRQPLILSAGPQVILAFAENRNVSACAPEEAAAVAAELIVRRPLEVGSLHLRRSTDSGLTWQPMQSLYVGNIDFYTAVHVPATDTVLLFLAHSGTVLLRSDDRGATWDAGSPFDTESVRPNPAFPSVGIKVTHQTPPTPSLRSPVGHAPCQHREPWKGRGRTCTAQGWGAMSLMRRRAPGCLSLLSVPACLPVACMVCVCVCPSAVCHHHAGPGRGPRHRGGAGALRRGRRGPLRALRSARAALRLHQPQRGGAPQRSGLHLVQLVPADQRRPRPELGDGRHRPARHARVAGSPPLPHSSPPSPSPVPGPGPPCPVSRAPLG